MIVCLCKGIKTSDLEKYEDLEEAIQETGCSTKCGACVLAVEEFFVEV